MRIRAFWAENFRSLRAVRLSELGPFNVFYGENGAGKSNILDALDVAIRAPKKWITAANTLDSTIAVGGVDRLVEQDDFCRSGASPRIVLGVTVSDIGGAPVFSARRCAEVTFEVVFERLAGRGTSLSMARLESDVGPLQGPFGDDPGFRNDLARWFETDVQALFRRIPAVRALAPEHGTIDTQQRSSMSELLVNGRLKEAFVLALTSPDPVVRERFKRLRELLAGEPLYRPPFDPVYDPRAQRFELRERLGGDDIPLDLAGLGIQQIYAIVGQILLGRASAVGVEEPEAHLHAPTSGRHLRVLLRRLVERGDLQQLFITTHSNLFDLDPTGYFDVRREQGETVVERRADLNEIDRRHLYEPGPAKHGLADLLRFAPPATPVLRRPDGTAVTAEEMLRLLQEDAPEAVDFLRDVHGAAVRAVQLRSVRKP